MTDIYLAGYAVECALKACIAKRVKRYEFPDRRLALDAYTHDIEQLVRIAELTHALEAEQTADATFGSHWKKVVKWSEGARYERWSLDAAKGLFDAIAEQEHGVLTWLRRHW